PMPSWLASARSWALGWPSTIAENAVLQAARESCHEIPHSPGDWAASWAGLWGGNSAEQFYDDLYPGPGLVWGKSSTDANHWTLGVSRFATAFLRMENAFARGMWYRLGSHSIPTPQQGHA